MIASFANIKKIIELYKDLKSPLTHNNKSTHHFTDESFNSDDKRNLHVLKSTPHTDLSIRLNDTCLRTLLDYKNTLDYDKSATRKRTAHHAENQVVRTVLSW